MNNLTKVFLLMAVLLASTLVAQREGILHITEAFSIRTLLDHRKSLNFQKERKLKAWSVQLLLSRDKYLATRKVVEVKKSTRYITSKVDWFYQAPYYRIYAGAFYTKLEAATLLNLLIEQFPDAIVFKNTEARPTDM